MEKKLNEAGNQFNSKKELFTFAKIQYLDILRKR